MSILLTFHIVAFTLSILTTLGMLGVSMARYEVRDAVVHANIIVTLCGLLSGGVLLLSKPLGVHCALLFSYLAAFIAVTIFVNKRNISLQKAAEL